MGSFAIGLVLMALVSADVLVISGENLAHINTETGTVTPSVGTLHTYPNSVDIVGNFAYVVNSGTDTGTLQRFELGTWNVVELGIGTGWNCWASIPASGSAIAVSAALHNSIVFVDPTSMEISSVVEGVGPNPEWMACNGNLLYAACGGWGSGQSVVVVNTTTGSVVDTLTAGTNCQSVVLDDTNKLFATCSNSYGSDSGFVAVIDLTTGETVSELYTGGFPGFSVSTNGVLYTADPWGAGVFSVDMNTLTVLHDSTNPFCSGGNGMAVDESGYLWISDGMNNEVRVYDNSENLVETYSVTSPSAIAVSGSWLGIGHQETGEQLTVSVSPNPAFGSITVAGTRPGDTVRVYDITGRTQIEGTSDTSGSCFMDVSRLSPGLYTVVDGSHTVRFVVSR